jgi:hypothetical protein
MPILNSPGVDVSVIDESFYASSGQGTIPLLLIATREGKIHPSGGTVAEGTLKAKANQLYLMGSQRELNQTFGDAVFASLNGTPLHGNELNEYGLHAAYSYLGLANRAYIVRGDIDLDQLEPLAEPPRGAPVNGTVWFDLNEVRWGVFTGNGASNPGLAWDLGTVHEINVRSRACTAIIGKRAIPVHNHAASVLSPAVPGVPEVRTDPTVPVDPNNPATGTPAVPPVPAVTLVTAPGILMIDGYAISLVPDDTFQTILTKIRSAGIPDISATLAAYAAVVDGAKAQPPVPNPYAGGMVYNLKLSNARGRNINLTGTAGQILTDLGLSMLNQVIEPLGTLGSEGDYAVLTVGGDNRLFQKITPRNHLGVPVQITSTLNGVSYLDVGPLWYWVGTTGVDYSPAVNSPMSAWDWTAATPTVVTSRAVTAPFAVAGTFEIESDTGPVTITINVGEDLSVIHRQINENAALANSSIVSYWSGIQLTISRLDGTDLEFGTDTAGILAGVLGIAATVHRGNRLHYATHAQVPVTGAVGDVWVKTTTPNSGARYTVKQYSRQLGQWRLLSAPLFANDADATAVLGSTVAVNSLYIRYDVYGNKTGTTELRRWNGKGWVALTSYEAGFEAPTTEAPAGSLWYSNNLKVDIMVSNGNQWHGYRNRYPGADIILSASEPFLKPLGGALIDEDLWIDTADLENYPRIYRYSTSFAEWQLIDTTDQTTPFGIVFADGRQDDGAGSTDDLDLMVSDYTDADVVDALSYPDGLLLWNTRLGTGNVKQWTPNYRFEGQLIGDRWVTVSGNKVDGSAYMLRKAQRIMIVRALAAAISGNEDLRSESVYFNLVACPGYPELIDELVALNIDKKQHAFIVADTPPRLKPTTSEIDGWARNTKLAASNGEEGLTTADMYVGVYYPWGLGVNVDGTEVMIPPSTMALRTFAYNDSVAYPWLAAAGFNRGMVSNATTVGYLTDEEEFKPVLLNQSQRDTLYLNNINPIAWIPNRGLVLYGQKTRYSQTSALDRINVARLTNYLRYHLELLAKPFLFEPNDLQTRDGARITFERFLADLVGLRALYDFAVVCDETNNTPERIDRNELWIDVGIQPIKSVEMIYIPIRVLNTGEDFGDQFLESSAYNGLN